MKSVIIFLMASTAFIWADESRVHKAVFDLSNGNPMVLKGRVAWNIRTISDNLKDQNKTLKSIVVISGDAYNFFIKDLKKSPYNTYDILDEQKLLEPILAKLQKDYDVTFQMCSVGMQKRGIDGSTLYPYVEYEKNKTQYLIEAQNDGYAYIPIN
ncbi:MAG: DsrE family protein [Campylobacterota bacterium]|nr:DsrE family protein [Campylobacterota bacterium]